jgi:hypothetical protein
LGAAGTGREPSGAGIGWIVATTYAAFTDAVRATERGRAAQRRDSVADHASGIGARSIGLIGLIGSR